MHYDSVLRQYVEAFYVCTGDEIDGLQEATIDGTTYFFYLANIHSGAVLRYANGHFYTNDPTMQVNVPVHETDMPLTPAQTENTQTISGRGQGGTPESGDYYGTVPEELRDQSLDTKVLYDVDGTPRWFAKQGDEWIEIPLLSAEEVEMLTNGIADLKMINVVQDGDIVEVS